MACDIQKLGALVNSKGNKKIQSNKEIMLLRKEVK